MSIFANRAIRVLDFYDNGLFVSAQHKTLFLLNHSKYDAYRNTTNLHFNQVYTGEGATSKSFLFEKMEEMSIQGTVQTLTYQTTRADAIDGDQNDTIHVFNEAPPGMFITNKNVDNTQEAMFKESLFRGLYGGDGGFHRGLVVCFCVKRQRRSKGIRTQFS